MDKSNSGTLAGVRSHSVRRIRTALMGFAVIAAIGAATVPAAQAENTFDANRTTVTGNSAG